MKSLSSTNTPPTSTIHTNTPTNDNTTTIDIAGNLQEVRRRIAQQLQLLQQEQQQQNQQQESSLSLLAADSISHHSNVRLVAVSKTQPMALIQRAYEDAHQRVFGENYVQELLDKAHQFSLLHHHNKYNDMVWHLIGPLQSNKVNGLIQAFCSTRNHDDDDDDDEEEDEEGDDTAAADATVEEKEESPPQENYYYYPLVIETVASEKLARKLNSALDTLTKTALNAKNQHQPQQRRKHKHKPRKRLLRVMVQVNTSREASKSGVALLMNNDGNHKNVYDNVVDLCRFIVEQCPHLQLMGLMTIGAIVTNHDNDNNEERPLYSDFDTLRACRNHVAAALHGPVQVQQHPHSPVPLLELSMGMSGDYEAAIARGSTNVRVGSTIFGKRSITSPAIAS